MRTKYIIMALVLCCNILYAAKEKLINTARWEYRSPLFPVVFSNSTTISNDFYKFYILSWVQNPVLVPGGEVYIRYLIHNVGSISETNGIAVRPKITAPGFILTMYHDAVQDGGLYDRGVDNALLTNITKLTSGGYYYFWGVLKIPPDTTLSSYNVVISNTGLTFNYVFFVTNEIKRYYVDATDGIHSATHQELANGTAILGDLDVTVRLYLQREEGVNLMTLYYDVDGIPTGTVPDGTIHANRAVIMQWKTDHWQGVVPIADEELKPGKQVLFIFKDAQGRFYQECASCYYSWTIKQYGVEQVTPEEPFIITDNLKSDWSKPVAMIFTLNRRSHVNITVYNLRGEIVRRVVNQVYEPGKYTTFWDGRNEFGREVGVGLYIIYIKTVEYDATRKLVFIKKPQ